jgi:hypothetical protein
LTRHDERSAEPSLPVAVPRAVLEPPPTEPIRDDDEPLDWRIGVGIVGFLWAAFTSLMLSVAPTGPNTVATWLMVTIGAMNWSVLQWRRGTWRERQAPLPPLPSSTTRNLEPPPDEAG